jgi:hypothetical protein
VPWPTYSERFLHHQAAGIWSWTVPEDMRAVVTNIDLVNYAEPGVICSVTIGPIFAEYVVFQAGQAVIHRVLRTVAYQGEVVKMTLTADGIHASVGGYLFRDDTGRTGPPPSASTKPDRPGRPLPAPLPS